MGQLGKDELNLNQTYSATIILLTAVAVAIGSAGALADTTKDLAAISAQAAACVKKAGTDSGMKGCSAEEYLAADKVLNLAYRSAAEKLRRSGGAGDQEVLKRLIASERAWVAYRDAECSLQGAGMLGGSGEGLEIEGCLVTTTIERIQSLEKLFRER